MGKEVKWQDVSEMTSEQRIALLYRIATVMEMRDREAYLARDVANVLERHYGKATVDLALDRTRQQWAEG